MMQHKLAKATSEAQEAEARPEDRRTAKRVTYRTEIEWIGPDIPSITTRTENLSTGGTFIKAITRLPVGSTLKMKFSVGSKEVRVTGEVCYCLPQKGIGVRFLDLSPEQRAAIEALIQERAQ